MWSDESLGLSSIKKFSGLAREHVTDILQRIARLKVGVIGDGCLDMYWHADMTVSELSRETPHYNVPVIGERFAPGAAGNAAVNFKALGCEEVSFCSIAGDDWRGHLLKEALRSRGINDAFVHLEAGRATPAYCKVMLHGLQEVRQEAPRIDFINTEGLTDAAGHRVVQQLDRMAERVDVISVTDQLQHGVVGAAVRERLSYWAGQGKQIVVDSRDRIGKFKSVVLKPNELEALRWYNGSSKHQQATEGDILKAGLQLSKSAGAACCITLGEKGAVWFENEEMTLVPTQAVPPPIDIVGAGDSFTAAFLSAWGTGCSGPEAAAFAHLAAAVTVSKCGETGTASPEEIMERCDHSEV
ncbi:rfaE bifunctional protein, domain I [Paenibacillus sp. 1_12]|uniref:bifunctional heptose 7-phosphate kinase/heptose 1-phosphate adenyltransferase n=1 Tax=Paenibacillus sp. 1_12 TaxID=1566278 RepID=UPI0008DF7EE4|nr:PfkB family carbohydrate kinase [Paenibacillus sp. 1_12]SFL21773.1 rfaE bifunctional protein, domain I [Paenibacillus sp. 1_12]